MLRYGRAVLPYHCKAPAPKPPPGNNDGRRFYSIEYRENGSADVFLMPFECVKLAVRGVVPWDGMEDDIRARYYDWCASGVIL